MPGHAKVTQLPYLGFYGGYERFYTLRVLLFRRSGNKTAPSRHRVDKSVGLQVLVRLLNGVGIDGGGLCQFPDRGQLFILGKGPGDDELLYIVLYLFV